MQYSPSSTRYEFLYILYFSHKYASLIYFDLLQSIISGMNCPGVVFGVGLSRQQAQAAARVYADMRGTTGCARYVGHCQIEKFIK